MRIRIRDQFDPLSGLKNSDPGSGINIPDPQHCVKYGTVHEKSPNSSHVHVR
jgi:hypothetical protein